MWWMLRNSAGKKDAMFTFAAIAFFVTIFSIVAPMLNGFHVPWTDYVVGVEKPDVTLVTAFMAASFTSYVIRRNKKDDCECNKEE